MQISHQLLLQKMKLFGGLFDYGSVDFKEAKAFQREFLDKYDINIKETLNKARKFVKNWLICLFYYFFL